MEISNVSIWQIKFTVGFNARCRSSPVLAVSASLSALPVSCSFADTDTTVLFSSCLFRPHLTIFSTDRKHLVLHIVSLSRGTFCWLKSCLKACYRFIWLKRLEPAPDSSLIIRMCVSVACLLKLILAVTGVWVSPAYLNWFLQSQVCHIRSSNCPIASSLFTRTSLFYCYSCIEWCASVFC